MKNYLLFFALVLFSIKTKSQGMLWTSQMGGAQQDIGQCVKVDGSGNVYSIGYFSGTADFNPGAATYNMSSFGGSIDIYISKLDASGNFLWAKQIGGTGADFGSGIALDASGNVYAVGGFSGTADFDPSAATVNMTSFGSGDIYVLKLNSAGIFQWVKRMGGTGNDNAFRVALDASGNIITTGAFSGTCNFNPAATFNLTSLGTEDVFISKLDPSGNFLWAKAFGSASYDAGESVNTDAAGNVYTTGYVVNSSTVDFDPGPGTYTIATSSTSNDLFVSKLDAAGNFVFARTMGASSSNVEGFGITIDPSGNIYTTGQFSGFPDMDPGAGSFILSSYGSWDAFVNKLDPSGNFLWAVQFNGTLAECGLDITTDALGNVYTCGYHAGLTDFQPGSGTYSLPSSGGIDFFISKLTPAGVFGWAFGGGSTLDDSNNAIAVDASTNIYTTGYFSGNSNFGGSVTYTINNFGNEDAFVEKLASCPYPPPTPGVISGSIIICSGISTTYSAAPVTNATSYTWAFPGGWTGTSTTNIVTATIGASSGNVSLTAVNACGNSPVKLLTVNVSPGPGTPGTISGLTSICSGSGASTYSIAPVSGAGSYNWVLPSGWSGSSATNTISATPGSSGTFSVSVTNTCGTGSPQTLSVSVITIPTTPTAISGTTTICSGSVKLYNVSAVANAANYNWMLPGGWTGSSSTNNINVTSGVASGAMSVTASNACGTSAAQTLSVTVNATPTISVNSGSICSGQSFTIIPVGASTYTYSGGSAIVSPTTTTGYSVTGTSALGCVSSVAAISNITVHATPTITVPNGTICIGNSFTLSPNGASTYTFSSGSAVVSPTSNTSYSITGTSAFGCVSPITAIATVTVSGTLTVTIAGSNTVCSGQPVSLTANGAATYTWNNGANSTTIAPAPTANTSYSVIGASGSCSNTALFSVTVSTLPNVTSSTSSSLICAGQTATLNASGSTTYTWNTSANGSQIVVSPTLTTTYTVTGTDALGCFNTSTIIENVSLCTLSKINTATLFELQIFPNPFTNKTTIVCDVVNQSVEIFNSVGSLVYKIILESVKTEIDLSSQAKGIYFIRIGSVTKKIIKE